MAYYYKLGDGKMSGEIGLGIDFERITEEEFRELHRALKDSLAGSEIYYDELGRVKAEFWDSLEQVEVTIKKKVNQYGISEFKAKAIYLDFGDTIVNCYSCDDCAGEECFLYNKTEEELNEYIEKEIEEHTKTKIKIKFMGTEIYVEPIVLEKYDVLAKGVEIYIKTTNFADLLHALGLLHILFELPFSIS